MLSMLASFILSGAIAQGRVTATPKEAHCTTLSGTYSFIGKLIGPSGANSASELRFDEKAMGMTERTVIAPYKVVLSHDVVSGNVSAELVGTGIDQRFVGMSANLPLTAIFACADGFWVREKIVAGGAGGGRPTETKVRISLRSTPAGVVAEGAIARTTGTISRRTQTQEWRILFERKNAHSGQAGQDSGGQRIKANGVAD